ncbi:MAG: hypothetical protein V4633_17345 [Pseudomonadota bacterium]
MSQFEHWEHELAVDLRILRRPGDENDDYRMVLSFSLDALTSVPLEEVERLMIAGVPEITELPD